MAFDLPELNDAFEFLPKRVNSGNFVTAYTLPELMERTETCEVVLPLCSLGTAPQDLSALGPLVLPPLYHEAMDAKLRDALLARIHHCFPYLVGSCRRASTRCKLKVIDLPRNSDCVARISEFAQNRQSSTCIAAFSVDTAVEQHGPHLPLATDTLQSYAILASLSREFPQLLVMPPVDYGQLTWGLPYGMSIDLTAPLVSSYVAGYVNAVLDCIRPSAVLVVDVHGSMIHRTAIQEGLAASRSERWSFRWLHEPLVAVAGDRGDQHAGGVETAIVEAISPHLVDGRFWPSRLSDLSQKQLPVAQAISLSSQLDEFSRIVEEQALNGIVGRIENYSDVSGPHMLAQMLQYAREAVLELV